MVFARNALASGPGNAWNSIHLPPIWRKVKGGKPGPSSGCLFMHFSGILPMEHFQMYSLPALYSEKRRPDQPG
jgi:hypothetical protein